MSAQYAAFPVCVRVLVKKKHNMSMNASSFGAGIVIQLPYKRQWRLFLEFAISEKIVYSL